MSTVTSTTPRLITPTDQPVCPCWLWESSTARWHLFTEDTPGAWGPVWTHWVSVEATRPSPVADLTIDSVTPEDRKLAAELHAQRGGDLTSIALGVCHGRIRENERFIPVDGSTREWVPKDERDAAVAEEISRLKCAHSDMADLYAKERALTKQLTENLDSYRRDCNRAVEISEQLDARVEQLKGQLEAAEQHVKILTEQRDEAVSDARALIRLMCKPRTPTEVARLQGKVHPWRQEEVPLGTWFRRNDGAPDCLALLGVHKDGVTLAHGYRPDEMSGGRKCTVGAARALSVSLEKLAEHWDHSTDGGKTWLPAGRIELLEAAA